MSGTFHPLRESPEALYEESPCGYLSILPHGEIIQANRTLQRWTGYGADALCGGMRFPSLLSMPSALLYETHCVPLLRLRGFISEIALELKAQDGQALPVLLSAAAQRDEAGELRLIRVVIMSAPTRRQYERELVRAREQAEEAAEQLRELRALAERKVAEQAALLEAVGRMASGDLLTPVQAGEGGQLAPLSRALEHMRKDVLNTLRQMDARAAEVLQLNRELRHQIEQRSRLMIESIGAIEAIAAAKATGSAPVDDGALEAQPLLPPGTRISDRYRIAAILGQGGMGTVYEVERILDGRRYAAKVLGVKPNFQAMLRFAREAQLLARLHHPNLVGIIDVDMTVDRVAFIVMELVRGPSLAELRAHYGERPFILPILFQITEALAAVHRAGVVHRDLKPANVLIMFSEDDQPIVKLVDFGVSRLHDPGLDTPSGQAEAAREVASVALSLRGGEAASLPTLDGRETIELSALARTEVQEPERPARPGPADADAAIAPLRLERVRPRRSSEELTLPGTLLGTPLYMAPELRGGAQLARPASDVFSFGVLAYEVLTGTLPFEQPPLLWAELGITELTYVPLARLCPGLEPTLASLLEDCLRLDPARRPTTDALSETMLRAASVHT
ncbi:MAG: protein kinase [Polyangia bacterium]